MSKSATVFVNYLTSWYACYSSFSITSHIPYTNTYRSWRLEPIADRQHYSAAEHAQRSGKKTVMPQDVFSAMTELEFEFMLPRLEAEVTKFTSIQADKRNTYRKKVRDEKKAATSTPTKPSNGDDVGDAGGDDTERAAKRARRSSVGDGGASGDASEAEEADETADVEDEDVEDDEIEEEVVEEGLTEDPLEEREEKDEDDEMGDGDESD